MKRLAHYSQYFLRSPRLVGELIGHTSIRRADTVYDIGAGSGIISTALAKRCTRVVAIEAEPRIAQKLRANVSIYTNVSVIETDFLAMSLPAEPYKVFANIPFHLSAPIVRKLTTDPYPPKAAYLIVQKQFAHRLLADTLHPAGQLGMQLAPWFSVRIRRPLKKTDYFPHPNVDTVLLEIKRRPEPLLDAGQATRYRKMIERCFADPKEFARMPREAIGLQPGSMPSRVTIEQWLALYATL